MKYDELTNMLFIVIARITNMFRAYSKKNKVSALEVLLVKTHIINFLNKVYDRRHAYTILTGVETATE